MIKTASKSIPLKSILFISFLIFSGCIKHSSGGTPEPTQHATDDKSLLSQKDQESKKVFQRGGQPGLITLSGILVSQDLKLDSHVETISETGFGKDGTESNLDKAATCILSPQADKISISAELKTLITLGCDQSFTDDLAKKRSLDIQKTLPPVKDQKITLRAKTVVLCGNISDLHTSYLSVEADELILNSADLLQVGTGGSISFVTNKLFLFGSNIIATQGSESDVIFVSAPSITLKVAQQLIADDSARLLLVSKGSSYADK